MFVVYYSKEATQNLEKLDNVIADRIFKKIDKIREDPFLFIDRLVSVNLWKLRVGDYRVLLDVNRGKNAVFVISINHRRSVYKNLR